MDNDYTTPILHPLWRLFNNLFLRKKIWQYVKEIHNNRCGQQIKCNWYDLGCFPDELIKFGYIKRYKFIYNILFKNKDDNDKEKIIKVEEPVIEKFRDLYLESASTAIRLGNCDVLEFLHKEFPGKIDRNTILNSVSIKNITLDFVKFLHKHKLWHNASKSQASYLIHRVTLEENFEVLKYLHAHVKGGWSTDIMDAAASRGNMEIIKFLLENRTEGCSNNGMRYAAINNHLETVKFLHENMSMGFRPEIIHQVTSKGHLEMLMYMLQIEPALTIERLSMDYAALNGHFEMVKFLHDRGVQCSSQAMDYAAKGGHIEIVKFLHYNRTEGCTMYAMEGAATKGKMDVLLFLHENRTEGCTRDSLYKAAIAGNLETVMFLMENRTDAVFPNNNTRLAKNITDFRVFKYLAENRSEFASQKNFDFVNQFAKHNDSSPLQWFLDNTTLRCTEDAYLHALHAPTTEPIKWLHKNTTFRLPDYVLRKAATENTAIGLEMVEYLHSIGATTKKEAMDGATDLSIIQFLHKNRKEGCTMQAMWNAIMRDDLQTIKFLDQNRTEHLNQDFTQLRNRKTYGYQSRLEVIKEIARHYKDQDSQPLDDTTVHKLTIHSKSSNCKLN